MVVLDPRFVLDCARGVPSAIDRLDELRGGTEPLYLSIAARAAVQVDAAERDVTFRRRAEELLGCVKHLEIDPESVRCAAEIAGELARQGRRLDGVDLFVAASARQHGQTVVSRNRAFESVPGLVRQSY